MATRAQTPVGRGFVSSLGYFHSENDYFTQQRAEGCGGEPFVDLWDTEGPATGLNASGPDGGYEERIFTDRALRVIAAHPPALPLFLYYALHTSCVGPHGLQAPARFYEALSFIDDPDRRKNHAMIAFMDEAVGNLTAALHERGLWNNTLLVWSADNGGAVHLKGGANAFPLRGGYENNWEGGVRVAALVNGGFLPDHMRGRKITEPMHECDWVRKRSFTAIDI
jgi:arylsulfatase I/J